MMTRGHLKQRDYFDYSSRGMRVHQGGEAQKHEAGCRTGSLALTSVSKDKAERVNYKSGEDTFSHSPLPVIPRPPQTASPTGNQVCKYWSHRGHFSFKPLWCVCVCACVSDVNV